MLNQITNKVAGRIRRAKAESQLQALVDGGSEKLTRLGTEHGGWNLPVERLARAKTAVCVGAGEDISLDVELNKRGITVYTLDPTPRSKIHVEEVLTAAAAGASMPVNGSRNEHYSFQGFDRRRFTFADVGVWNEDTSMRFYAPKDKQHVSHSIVNLQHTDQFFEAKCMTLRSACDSLKIGEIDILKLDVEGAEYTILKDLMASGPKPAVLCTEFDEIRNPLDESYMTRVVEMVALLKKSGYRFAHAEHSNALFLR